jgi:hypothetical protein
MKAGRMQTAIGNYVTNLLAGLAVNGSAVRKSETSAVCLRLIRVSLDSAFGLHLINMTLLWKEGLPYVVIFLSLFVKK